MSNFIRGKHGEFTVALQSNVVVVHAYGPWNTECVEQFGRAYEKVIGESGLTQWADLVLLFGESLLIPEAEHKLRTRIKAAAALGLKRVALVIEMSSVKSAARMQMEKMYLDVGVDINVCESEAIARDWLAISGFELKI